MSSVPEPQLLTAEAYYRMTAQDGRERTELHDGEIVALARPSVLHQNLLFGLHRSIYDYIRANQGKCKVNQEIDVELSEDTVVSPDIAVICDPDKLNDHGCIGAPDWVIEVLSTNRSNDLDYKYHLYKISGVREYWIVDPKNEKTLVYFFEKNDFPDIYTFDTPIPVGIYDKAMSIRIADLTE